MKIIISGIVQGVGFRPFIYRVANKLNLSGYIQNCGDGIVEIYISGEKRNLDSFLSKIKEEKPILAKYDDIKIVQDTDRKDIKYNDFSIIKSSTKINTIGSPIQPDVGICNKCINDFSYGQRRNNYYFISCTDCGPKYSILENFPYDRINTTMNNFPICIKCNNEYNDPNNRLFHYELISCTDCGPKFSLIDRYGDIVTGKKDPILSCAKLITEGNIIAAKGIGGFHIITSATNSNPIIKVRNKKNRKNKPFAVMSRDLNSTKSFAIINEIEKRILSSSSRPIVLLNKNKKYYLSSAISSLNTIGVMLPYTGFHISLLNFVQDHVLVMTSGNDTNMPIIKDENKAIKSLSDCADYFLIHDRKIFTPCDDSIIKIIENVPILVRGSRGISPLKLTFKKKSSECILALGCEKNVTFSILSNSNCFLSQHIGNLYNIESYNYFKTMIDKSIKFLNQKEPSIFVCDQHPTLLTTKLAFDLSKKNKENSLVYQVQHHHAHMLSLMAEYDLTDMIGIVCDGVGYGLEGQIWGGEIFQCYNATEFERIGHLNEQPMIGGDLATINPLRMVAGILLGQVDGIEKFLYTNLIHFPYSKRELEYIISAITSTRDYPMTTSTGRILDAVSSLLGICYKRTFEGEPAITLESRSSNGKDISIPPKIISNNILDTTYLLKFIFENKDKYSIQDLAYSAQVYIAKGLASIAIDNALSSCIDVIGFSGGVSQNKIITKIIKKEVEKNGIKFLLHKNIPPGDGGISVGQAYFALNKLLLQK